MGKRYNGGKVDGRSQPKILGDMIEGLIQASNAASVLVHHLQDPRFMDVRSSLDLTIGLCRTLATSSLRYGSPDVKTTIGYKKPSSGLITSSEVPATPTKVIL